MTNGGDHPAPGVARHVSRRWPVIWAGAFVAVTALTAGLMLVSAGTSPTRRAAAVVLPAATADCAAPVNDCSPRDQSLAAQPAAPVVLAPSNPKPVTASGAMSMVAQDTKEFPNISRMGATETTWTQFWADQSSFSVPGDAERAALPNSEPLWLVAVVGTIHPSYAISALRQYSEAIVAVDANTGLILGVTAGPGDNGFFPQAFSALVADAPAWPAS